MLRRLITSLYGFVTEDRRYVRAPEYLLGYGALLWGLVVILPADSFGSAPGFAILRAGPLSELTWGCIVGGLGAATLIGVYGRIRLLRFLSALAGVFLWGSMAYSFFRVNALSTGWTIYGTVMTGASMLTLLRMGVRLPGGDR